MGDDIPSPSSFSLTGTSSSIAAISENSLALSRDGTHLTVTSIDDKSIGKTGYCSTGTIDLLTFD